MLVNKIFSSIIIVPLLVAGIYGYFKNIPAMKGSTSLGNALQFVNEHWEDGDIIFTTDDGPWINLKPYTDHPIYHMPSCDVPVVGSLSNTTRDALGVVIADLDDISYKRAWVFAPTSPLHPQCYINQIAQLTKGIPVMGVDDSEWLYSAVWLVYAPHYAH